MYSTQFVNKIQIFTFNQAWYFNQLWYSGQEVLSFCLSQKGGKTWTQLSYSNEYPYALLCRYYLSLSQRECVFKMEYILSFCLYPKQVGKLEPNWAIPMNILTPCNVDIILVFHKGNVHSKWNQLKNLHYLFSFEGLNGHDAAKTHLGLGGTDENKMLKQC